MHVAVIILYCVFSDFVSLRLLFASMTNFLQSKANEKLGIHFVRTGNSKQGQGGKEHYNYYIGQLIQGLSNNVLLNSKKKFFQIASVST